VTILLEGTIAGHDVQEVRVACQNILMSGCQLTLDLAGTSFVDNNGVAFLQSLVARNVRLLNCSGFVTEQLKPRKLE